MRKYLLAKTSSRKSTDEIDIEKLCELPTTNIGHININNNQLGVKRKPRYNNNRSKVLKKDSIDQIDQYYFNLKRATIIALHN